MESVFDGSRPSTTSASTGGGQRTESSTREHIINGHLPPRHPISQLQGAFEESIYESLQGEEDWAVDIDAQSRRRDLLENPEYERLCGRRWRRKAGERYHPFWKLTAQMSFGLHLLVRETAKSSTAVLSILQVHVDEMDGFVTRTTEDFLIIQLDLRTRIQYLSLPLENLDDFDQMLVDRSFRLAMIDYNEKIELAVERFAMTIGDTLKDIHKGREAIGALWQFLGQSAKENSPMSGGLTAIYNSMLANTEGWNSAFSRLRRKGVALQYAITQLSRAITEMQRRVGVASRKDVVSFVPPPPPTPHVKSIRGLLDRGLSVYASKPLAVEKPLPSDPSNGRMSNRTPSRPSARSSLPHQKSVPNMRATMALDYYRANDQVPDRARSFSGAPSRGSESSSVLPRFSKTLGRRLSRARLPARMAPDEATDESVCPSTSASRTLQSFRKGRHDQQPQQKRQEPSRKAPPPSRAKRPGTSSALAKGEAMRDQLLQYFKSDRVLEAWEGVTYKENKVGQSDSKKDGLWSIFQAKSSNMRSNNQSTHVFHDDIQKQMAWLEEETKNLCTYSLKPRSKTAPKLHTFSEHLSFQQHSDKNERHSTSPDHSEAPESDDSIITALPAFPLPPIGFRLPTTPEVPG